MNRVALDLGIFQVYWYSIFILLGVLSAIFIIYKEMKKQGLSKDTILDMSFYSILIGIIGARIYYVLFNLDYYLSSPIEIIKIYNGGLAIHGGLIAGCAYLIYFTKKHKINTLKVLDIIVVGLILGQAIGRWGNFFNQEAFGKLTTYEALQNSYIPKFIIDGMYINGEYYTPTFFYESITSIIGFILLLIMRKNKRIKIGQLSGFYLIWYSINRFFIEGLRTDSLMLGSIKIAQLVSLLLIIIGIILIFKNIKKRNYYHENKLIIK